MTMAPCINENRKQKVSFIGSQDSSVLGTRNRRQQQSFDKGSSHKHPKQIPIKKSSQPNTSRLTGKDKLRFVNDFMTAIRATNPHYADLQTSKSTALAAAQRRERKREINRKSAHRKRLAEKDTMSSLANKLKELSATSTKLKQERDQLATLLIQARQLKHQNLKQTSGTTRSFLDSCRLRVPSEISPQIIAQALSPSQPPPVFLTPATSVAPTFCRPINNMTQQLNNNILDNTFGPQNINEAILQLQLRQKQHYYQVPTPPLTCGNPILQHLLIASKHRNVSPEPPMTVNVKTSPLQGQHQSQLLQLLVSQLR